MHPIENAPPFLIFSPRELEIKSERASQVLQKRRRSNRERDWHTFPGSEILYNMKIEVKVHRHEFQG